VLGEPRRTKAQIADGRGRLFVRVRVERLGVADAHALLHQLAQARRHHLGALHGLELGGAAARELPHHPVVDFVVELLRVRIVEAQHPHLIVGEAERIGERTRAIDRQRNVHAPGDQLVVEIVVRHAETEPLGVAHEEAPLDQTVEHHAAETELLEL